MTQGKHKNSFKPLFIIFIVAVVLSVVIQPHGSAKGIIPWRPDLVAATQEAKNAHKPLFLEFSATWCGPCQQMAQTTWSDKAVAAQLEKMIPVQIDIDSHPDIKQEYGIDGIPAYLVVDADGKTVNAGVGYRTPEEFIAWLNGKAE